MWLPDDAPKKHFDVTAISIDKYQEFGPNWGKLVYNKTHRNFDSKAIIFIHTSEKHDFMHSPNYEPKPLVLRANAGDCLKVKVRNDITPDFVANDATATYGGLPDSVYQTTWIILHP